MAVDNYSGGNDTILTGFYNGLRNDLYRHQATLQKVAQQKAKSQEEFEKDINSELAKVNPNGLQQKDIPDFYKLYEEMKTDAQKARTTDSPQERAKYRANITNKANEIQLLVNASKNSITELQPFATEVFRNGEMYTEEARAEIKRRLATPTLQLDAFNPEAFVKQVDGNAVMKDIRSQITSTLKAQNPILKRVRATGGKAGVDLFEVRELSKDVALQKLTDIYETSPKVKMFITQQFPNQDPALVLSNMVNQLEEENLLNNKDYKQFISDLAPKDSSGSGGDGVEAVDTSRRPIPIANKNITPEAIVRISPTAVNLGGLQGYDIESDSYVTIPNVEGGVKIANVALYPFAKRGIEIRTNTRTGQRTSTPLGGKLAQSDYANTNPNSVESKPMALIQFTEKRGNITRERNMLVPVNDLPKDKKGIQKAIKNLGTGTSQNNSVSSQTTGRATKKGILD